MGLVPQNDYVHRWQQEGFKKNGSALGPWGPSMIMSTAGSKRSSRKMGRPWASGAPE